jgi:hypothetical protein
VFLRTFGLALGFTVVALVLALVYGGWAGLGLAAILAVLEISLSFDNAVVNATTLVKMNEHWRKMFLTLGVVIAVFGMRLVFPLLIVGITAKLTPLAAVRLALDKRPESDHGSYAYLLSQAHPAIAAFGGMFLLMLFLEYFFTEKELYWIAPLERLLVRLGKLDALPTIVSAVVLYISAETFASSHRGTILGAGILGIVTYLAVDGLGALFDTDSEDGESSGNSTGQVVLAAGKAGLALFLYLEVLDASFSFDGVIGAFAITSDPVLIALGLGIGAMFIRSLTLLLVRQGALSLYPYLEHGAHWAIGALSVLLLVSIEHEVPEVVTGLIGLGFIALAFASSLIRNRRATPPTAGLPGAARPTSEPAAVS